MQFEIFKNKNLIQGISDTSFGSMLKNNKKAIKFLKSLGYLKIGSKNLIWAEQVFSANLHLCQVKDSGKVIKGVDGLISNIPGQVLAITSADCVPILLYEPCQKIVAALHGGRECLVKGIIKTAISKMVLNFNSDPNKILVGIGPHIRKCHYWLREKTYQKLRNTFFKKYFVKRGKRTYFDLTKLTFDQLQREGILKKNIEDCKICTFCSYQKYFSARRKEEFPGIYPEKKLNFPSFTSFIGLLD